MTGMLEWRPPMLPDLFDWIESGLGGFPTHRAAPGLHGIRIEEQLTDDAYILCAELPGLDPEKDIEISATGDVLTVRAERTAETAQKRHTEFRYGSYARAVRLPSGTRWEDAKADYKDGLLTVTVPLARTEKSEALTIPVRREPS
ncbi:Hsp20 family protein [Streptomyces sp. SID8379]|uniref:Hsp20/alpha crystallin family protein n=1 Tax=unclassified Streptomyces TaxID=2593676 RepID=UPI0003609DA2|nr:MULTISPECIES: Hsp20/alpha crystallin family protein [unclassified Streptomyces]MYW67775.1 Hsp20 family protein [Streptomyces sp. SID8379]